MEQVTQRNKISIQVPCTPRHSGPGGGPPLHGICIGWKWKTVTMTVRVNLKNDGFMAPKYAVWSKGDSYNDQVHNYFYGDGPGGGYNDLELMRYKRTYTQGLNKKGELEKPMKETYKWLNRKVIK